MKKEVILVVGGAGFIGSHVNKMLNHRGYQTVVFDNLTRGNRKTVLYGDFVKGDLANPDFLNHLFETYSVIAVMHFAAYIDVGESVRHPAKYYLNNVAYTLNLLLAMMRYQIKTLIFSSSAAVYGYPLHLPIRESHPCHPINPYGESKWMIEKMLRDFETAYGLKFCSLRYFNAAGGDPEGKIKNVQQNKTNLIPRILMALKNDKEILTIYGTDYPTPDGTCIRDYVHIEDLGRAHITAMEQLLAGGHSNEYNLGIGKGYSVREVILAVEEILGKKVNVFNAERRPGDPPVLLADSSKAASQLNWQPSFFLEDIIEHAWKAFEF
ncbi:MAG: UDP-glucose 4-epimerase GalE [Parachlamydiaceae bacterium]